MIGSNPTEQSRVIAICLLAGKIMLQSGGETYRVEDTMKRMAAALGLPHSHSYVFRQASSSLLMQPNLPS